MRRIFYGWWIVGVAFLTQCVTVGVVFYSFGVFLTVLAEAFGWTRAEVSWGFSLVALCGAAYAPLVGRIVDRLGPRASQSVGAIVLTIGFILLREVESKTGFYILMGGVLSLGAVALGPLPSNTAVANWFVRQRGRALGIATAGISMGGVIFVPLTQYLIQRLGWRDAFAALGVIVLVVALPPVAWLMVRRPEDIGLRPDGDEPADGLRMATEKDPQGSMNPREAMRHRNFWLISVSFSLTMMGIASTLLHQVSFLGDRGVSGATAAWALGATAGLGVLGKLAFGYLADRFDKSRVIIWCFGVQILGLGLLAAAYNVWVVLLFVLVYGFAMGGNATLQAAIVAECFGRLYYGAITGRMMPFIVLGQAIGIPLVGAVRDSLGSYVPAFGAIALSNLVAMVCITKLHMPGRRGH